MDTQTQVELLAAKLQAKPIITVLTGAGVSAASGVPTFRDAGGLWADFKPEKVATPKAFARDPKYVWEWYQLRREKLLECEPNRGHQVLAAWSHRYPGMTIITQNVDGLHEKAGSQKVIRFHGSIWEVGCWKDCSKSPHRWRDETVPFPVLPPPCPYCDGILRPGIVWFGEGIDQDVLDQSFQSLRCDLFMVIGTSSEVYPAAGLFSEARENGAFIVEINPQKTAVSEWMDLAITGNSEDILDLVENALQA